MRAAVLIGYRQHEVCTVKVVAALVRQDCPAPPVLEGHWRVKSVGRQLPHGRLVTRPTCIEAGLDDANSEGEHDGVSRRVRWTTVNPAKLILDTEVLKKTRRALGVVYERSDRN